MHQEERKNWLITGVSSGLGKSLAEEVMRRGDFVIGTMRSQEQVEQFNQVYAGQGIAVELDICDFLSVEKVLNELLSKFGRIDVLVNNAGMGFIGAVEETSLEELKKVFDTNVFGTIKLTQKVLPVMRQKGSGHIIQVSSHGGIKAFAGFGIYNASKFALEGYSEALEQELAPLGIKVTIVEPGPFRTGFAGRRLAEAEQMIDDYQETAGAFRKKLKSVDGLQEGDPDKAAVVIADLVKTKSPALRLPLGKIALQTIRMKLESVKSDLEAGKQTAEQVVF